MKKNVGPMLSMLCVSCATLCLEMAHIRIFSFLFWHHLSYAIVTTALFGFAAAGAVLSCSKKLQESPSLPSQACLGLAVFGPLSVAILSRFQLDPYNLVHPGPLLLLALVYAVTAMPYFFGGLAILAPLSRASDGISFLYGSNLAGSALGCLAGTLLLRPLGAKGLILATSMMAISAFAIQLRRGRWWDDRRVVASAIATVGGVLSMAQAPLNPCSSKFMAILMKQYPSAKLEFSAWDPVCRLDVAEFPGLERNQASLEPFSPARPQKGIFQDGDASTWMTLTSPDDLSIEPRGTLYSLGYALLDRPKVLIIGTGGGRDVLEAVLRKASSVTGVEINRTIAKLVAGPYSEVVGGIFSRPEVHPVLGDGRWFVEKTRETFDLIQISGIDTQAALASGAYVLSENYLYTIESFQKYLDLLNEDGILSVSYLEYTPPRSSLRMASLASQALLSKGVKSPGQHIAVVSFPGVVTVLVKRSPFSPAQVEALSQFISGCEGLSSVWLPGRVGLSPFRELFNAFDAGQQKRFYRSYPMSVHPTTDDSPFFFSFFKWSRLLQDIRSRPASVMPHESVPIGLIVLGLLTVQSGVGSLCLVFAPLLAFHRRGLSLPGASRWIPYFVAVGIGYMFVEICLMQRLVLLLAHPTYSISVTLFALLLFSGVGSLISGKVPRRIEARAMWMCCLGLAILYPTYSLVLRGLIPHLLGLSLIARVGITVVLVFPLGILMGMPFPLGLRSIGNLGPAASAWALGANGAVSVMSSILCIVVALQTHFTATTLVAGLAYATAAACAVRGFRGDTRDG